MSVRIKAELTTGRQLRAGELFSTAGPDYWDHFDGNGAVGERVYIRTNVPCDKASDGDEPIYRLVIIPAGVPCDTVWNEAAALALRHLAARLGSEKEVGFIDLEQLARRIKGNNAHRP